MISDLKGPDLDWSSMTILPVTGNHLTCVWKLIPRPMIWDKLGYTAAASQKIANQIETKWEKAIFGWETSSHFVEVKN